MRLRSRQTSCLLDFALQKQIVIYRVRITTITGSRFWNVCTQDVTNIARHHARWRQARYEHEKTKKGQSTPRPQAGADVECAPAQTSADITASGTFRFVTSDRTQSTPPMINVSTGGPTMTPRTKSSRAGALNGGAISFVRMPAAAKMIAIIIEGTRLISPVRTMYLPIEVRLSNNRRSTHCWCFSWPVISCSGSKLSPPFSFKVHSHRTHAPFARWPGAILGLKDQTIVFS